MDDFFDGFSAVGTTETPLAEGLESTSEDFRSIELVSTTSWGSSFSASLPKKVEPIENVLNPMLFSVLQRLLSIKRRCMLEVNLRYDRRDIAGSTQLYSILELPTVRYLHVGPCSFKDFFPFLGVPRVLCRLSFKLAHTAATITDRPVRATETCIDGSTWRSRGCV
jgi:hypothetical protein